MTVKDCHKITFEKILTFRNCSKTGLVEITGYHRPFKDIKTKILPEKKKLIDLIKQNFNDIQFDNIEVCKHFIPEIHGNLYSKHIFDFMCSIIPSGAIFILDMIDVVLHFNEPEDMLYFEMKYT